MKPNLFKSRKFLIAVSDAVISIAVMAVTLYLADDIQTRGFVLGIIAALQPVIIAVINGIATEDAANMHAESTAYAADMAKEAATIAVGIPPQNVEGGAG